MFGVTNLNSLFPEKNSFQLIYFRIFTIVCMCGEKGKMTVDLNTFPCSPIFLLVHMTKIEEHLPNSCDKK